MVAPVLPGSSTAAALASASTLRSGMMVERLDDWLPFGSVCVKTAASKPMSYRSESVVRRAARANRHAALDRVEAVEIPVLDRHVAMDVLHLGNGDRAVRRNPGETQARE